MQELIERLEAQREIATQGISSITLHELEERGVTNLPTIMSDMAAALDQAATALRDLTAWQDIATAPKDGTWILATVAGKHPETSVPWVPCSTHWNDGEWTDDDWMEGDWPRDPYEPTHWRPLPSAPAKAA